MYNNVFTLFIKNFVSGQISHISYFHMKAEEFTYGLNEDVGKVDESVPSNTDVPFPLNTKHTHLHSHTKPEISWGSNKRPPTHENKKRKER